MPGFVDDGGPWRSEPALRHFELLLYLGRERGGGSLVSQVSVVLRTGALRYWGGG